MIGHPLASVVVPLLFFMALPALAHIPEGTCSDDGAHTDWEDSDENPPMEWLPGDATQCHGVAGLDNGFCHPLNNSDSTVSCYAVTLGGQRWVGCNASITCGGETHTCGGRNISAWANDVGILCSNGDYYECPH